MSAATGERQAYPHPHVNEAWLAKLREDIIDPGAADRRCAPSSVGAQWALPAR